MSEAQPPTAAPIAPASSASSSFASSSAQAQNSLVVSLIHRGEAEGAAAKRLQSVAADRLRKLERAWAKLAVAHAELDKQAQGCATAVEGMGARCAGMDAAMEALQTDFAARHAELQAVLDALAARTLAACLQPERSPTPPPMTAEAQSASGGGPQRTASNPHPHTHTPLQTLLDFVDGESLAQVHAHYLRQIERLAQVGETARGMLSRADAQLAEVRTLQAQLQEKMHGGDDAPALVLPTLPPLPLAASALPASSAAAVAPLPSAAAAADPSVLGQCRAAYALLEVEAAQMPPLFAHMCSSYDRVRQARAQQTAALAAVNAAAAAATNTSAASTSDAAAAAAADEITREIASMQQSLQQLQAHSHRASLLSAHMESCSGAHSALYSHTLLLFNALQSLGPSLKSALASFQSLELECASVGNNAAGSIAELRNLCLFYVEFERAYDALLQELQRRHRQMAHFQSLMATVRAQLAESVATEVAEREAFWTAHGRFLPPSLCPALAEPVTDVRIVPEQLVSDLPVYLPSPEEAQRAVAVATRRGEEEARMEQQQQQQQQHLHYSLQQHGAAEGQQQQQQQHPSLDHSAHAAQAAPALSASTSASASASGPSHSAPHQQQQQQQSSRGAAETVLGQQYASTATAHFAAGGSGGGGVGSGGGQQRDGEGEVSVSVRSYDAQPYPQQGHGQAQAQPQHGSGILAPTPMQGQARPDYHYAPSHSAQQQQQQQPLHQSGQHHAFAHSGSSSLPPSSALSHSSTHPPPSATQHAHTQQLNSSEAQTRARTVSQPPKPVAPPKGFTDDD